jgi:tRNA pseudouridine55 synthase
MALLLAPDVLVAHLPRLEVDAEAAQQLMHGKHISNSADLPDQGMVRVYAPPGFLGLANSSNGTLVPSRLMATASDAGRYPAPSPP